MGMIDHNPELTDDYSAEVIRLARERSPETDAWFVEQRFLQETPDDNLSPLWFRNRCVIRICDELAEMGVRVHRDPDTICDEPAMVYAVLMLRKKYDSEQLFELLRDHADLVQEILSDLCGDTLVNILNWCKMNLPLDEGWMMLADWLEANPDILDGEDRRFIDRLNDVLDRVAALGEPDATSEVGQDALLKYVNFLGKRAEAIAETAKILWANAGDTEYARKSREQLIDRQMQNFEKHLGSRKCLNKVVDLFDGVDLKNPDEIDQFLQHTRQPYKHLWSSCLEFYVGEETKPCTECNLAIILATLIVDCPHKTIVASYVMHELDEFFDRLGENAVESIRLKFKEMMTRLVNPLEIDYAS